MPEPPSWPGADTRAETPKKPKGKKEKPAKEFYQKLLDTYQLEPSESIMIGNDIKADIKGARAVGLDTLYIYSNISPWEDEKHKDTDIGATFTIWDGDFTKVRKLVCKE